MSSLRQPFYRVEVKGLDVEGVATSDAGYDSQGDEMGLTSLVRAFFDRRQYVSAASTVECASKTGTAACMQHRRREATRVISPE
jgi:hypothetical protein